MIKEAIQKAVICENICIVGIDVLVVKHGSRVASSKSGVVDGLRRSASVFSSANLEEVSARIEVLCK
jgi:anthranilate phosphoribosyltransferase